MLSYEKGYSNSTIEVLLLYAKSGCLFSLLLILNIVNLPAVPKKLDKVCLLVS